MRPAPPRVPPSRRTTPVAPPLAIAATPSHVHRWCARDPPGCAGGPDGVSTTSKALLWALVAIVPLAIGAVALARWDRAAAVAAAETEARRSAESIARTVEFTTNISLRQLAAVADDPRFVAAIARSDWQWIEDDLQHIGINPV